jgi:uncharacterized membrane protein YfhO
MWFDSVIYLPLILIGLERLFKSDKPILYCLTLALTIFSSFYIGFSICIFLVIYFVVLLAINEDNFDFNTLRKKFFSFAVYSILAGGLTALTILPVYNTITLTIASEIDGPTSATFYHTFADYVYSLFPDTKLSTEYYVPNIFTGDFIFFMLPLFFFNHNIPFKKKTTYAALLGFLYLSMNLNVLDYVWHGFHFPNQLPGRWTFIFSLVCIIVVYECLDNLKYSSLNEIIASFWIAVIFVYFARYTTSENYAPEQAESMVKSMFVYTILAMAYIYCTKRLESTSAEDNTTQLQRVRAMPMVVTIIMSGYMVFGIDSNTINVISRDMGTSSLENYTANDGVKEYIKQYESQDDDFYRMELNSGYTFNSSQLYNYKGIGYYSSTMNGNVYSMFESLGCRVYAKNVSTVYNVTSPILDSFLSLKYVFSRDTEAKYVGMTEEDSFDSYKVLSNDYWLPLAFHVSDDIMSLHLDSFDRPLEAQNALVNKSMGEDVDCFELLPLDEPTTTNVSIDTSTASWNSLYYTTEDNSQPVSFKYSYVCTDSTNLFMQSNFRKGTLTIDSKYGTQTVDLGLERFKCLGEFMAGDTIDMEVTCEEVSYGLYGLELYNFNQDKMEYVVDKLSTDSLDIESFNDTDITGTINMSTSGMVYTSIPNDNGWKVYCDGSEVEVYSISNTLVGFELPEGTHTIEFKYHVVGFRLGVTVSLVCLALLVLLTLRRKGILKKKALLTETIEVQEPQSTQEVQAIQEPLEVDSTHETEDTTP